MIYLDHNATTPVDASVLDAMLPFLRNEFGNPSSNYPLGRRAHAAIETARTQVAALIGAQAGEITFTSGGTEASNIAIRGALRGDAARKAVVTSQIEHPATEECCRRLEHEGHRVRRIAPMSDGCIDPHAVVEALDADVALVTLIHAQNEIGTLQPVAAIAQAAHEEGALVHIDAAQSLGKIPVDVNALGVDLLSLAGHKLYAPKGIGALYVRHGVELQPLLAGAGQEHGRRAGTENVASIVGLGVACHIAACKLVHDAARLTVLSKDLLARLRRAVPGLVLVGHPDVRLPNTLDVLFPDVSGRKVLEACPDVLASTGSACHADSEEPSAILTALRIPRDKALGAVRLSLGRATTAAEIETAATSLAAAWRRVSARSSAAVA